MQKSSVSLLAGLLAALFAQGASAQAKLEIQHEKYKLENGLEVIFSVDKKLPIVAVDVWYHVGAVDEQPGKTGFAHLFEHVMFQGSKHVEEDTFFKYLQRAGASTVNGSTNFDRTNYFEVVPSNQLELALWLESDRMGFLLDTLSQERLDGQRMVVRNERRQRTDNVPYGLATEKIFQAFFPKDHPYRGVVIGSHEDLEAATLGDVSDFFRKYYQPANATLTIVGDFNPEEARKLVAKYFGPVAKGGPIGEPVLPAPNKITSELRLPVLKDNVTLPRLYYAWLTPAFFKPGDAEADLVARILAGGKSSRLYKRLVYEEKIAQDVAAFQQSIEEVSVFVLYVTAKPGVSIEKLEKAVDEELEKLRSEPVTEEELTRARRAFEVSTFKGLERVLAKAESLQRYNHYLGDPGKISWDVERYKKASAAALQKFAKDYLKTSSRVALVVEPEAAK